jgi:hypothetical protein
MIAAARANARGAMGQTDFAPGTPAQNAGQPVGAVQQYTESFARRNRVFLQSGRRRLHETPYNAETCPAVAMPVDGANGAG